MYASAEETTESESNTDGDPVEFSNNEVRYAFFFCVYTDTFSSQSVFFASGYVSRKQPFSILLFLHVDVTCAFCHVHAYIILFQKPKMQRSDNNSGSGSENNKLFL